MAGQVASQQAMSRQPGAAVLPSNNLIWILGTLVFVTLVVVYAAQRAGQSPATAPGGPPVGAPAVDISSMSPEERASRLFDRIMRLAEEGKRDSVELFASMAVPVFESLGSLDLDARYDLGRIALVSGRLDLARGQADTILTQSPSHLLGLILAISVEEARGNESERAALERRLVSAEVAQLATALPEYARHRADIDVALAAAKRRR